ncbi:MAG TPA: pyruvoyl-dependent arginine decarboxylase, partial [Armatimonadetes bacterium]|nr:pyruvoyl-dependent arginine decarboxylase [Armatimonadota bacterium]
MEAEGEGREEVEGEVRRMILEAFKVRGLEVEDLRVASVEHEVRECGCVVAACVFF